MATFSESEESITDSEFEPEPDPPPYTPVTRDNEIVVTIHKVTGKITNIVNLPEGYEINVNFV